MTAQELEEGLLPREVAERSGRRDDQHWGREGVQGSSARSDTTTCAAATAANAANATAAPGTAGAGGPGVPVQGAQGRRRRRSRKYHHQQQQLLHLKGRAVGSPIDVTFQHMEMRKHLRRIWGTYSSDRPYTMLWAFLTLLLVFGVLGASLSKEGFWIKLNIGQLGFWGLITIITVAIIVYTLTRVIVVFRWMLYWLMLAEALNIMLNQEYNLFGSKSPGWLTISLIVVEILTLGIYLFVHYAYPRLLASDWFHRHIGAKRWYEVRMIGPWTLTYSSGLTHRYTCTYRGETNADGLPHGVGHWIDDAYHGEILTGWWENGRPVGPFRSREFGSGCAFDTLVIGFVSATDDEFGSFKFFPTNAGPARCGVASVECSVSGEFFSHLPASRVLFGPFELDTKSIAESLDNVRGSRQSVWLEENPATSFRVSATISDCLQRLKFLSAVHPVTSVFITANQGRGVTVAGHTFAETSQAGQQVRQVVVDVIYPDDTNEEEEDNGLTYGHGSNQDPAGPDAASARLDHSLGDSSLSHEDNLDALFLQEQHRGERRSRGASTLHPSARMELADELDTIDSHDGTVDDGDLVAPRTPSLRSSLGFAELGLPGAQRSSSLTDMVGGDDDDDDDDDDDEEEEEEEEEADVDRMTGRADSRRQVNAKSGRLASYLEEEEGEEGNFLCVSEDHTVPLRTDRSSGRASNSILRQNMDGGRYSDVDSVEYDSSSFSLEPFSLNGGRPDPRSISARSARHRNKLLLNSAQGTSVSNGFDGKTETRDQAAHPSARTPHLRVRDWRSSLEGHAEALIFIPGFNSSLRHNLERLGQFLAMGHFPPHIKPFVFNWPAGQVATYLWAVEKAADERTVAVFGSMLDGLRDAGIRDVHFLTHSMGVHALMGAFADKPDGSRSDVSRRFSLAPDFAADQHGPNGAVDGLDVESGAAATQGPGLDGQPLLRARTITLLNPDYPLASFVNHGFATIRCVCDHVTVIGNCKDGALFWSELGNGAMQTIRHFFGTECYPAHLSSPPRRANENAGEYSAPKDPDSCCPRSCVCCFRSPTETEILQTQGQDRLFSKQLTVGRSIFSLFAPCNEHQRIVQHSASLFLERVRRGPRAKRKRRRHISQRPWLDLDAIDTTWMEANVHKLRHNYFNLNPVLVEDLQELIVTGRRAADRSMLLHREGNIFSYCQAPAFIVNEN
ncbi:Hypothetical Protein FCC1311_006232 [Hondaea fermentalgiana]|uniref:Uncharacterized protein n=1 Tax=Hondaea fermentalgiana TaxID=2315210 RepID=A0A2R5G1K6_9STRA|nr:Hypothetical Protein FCC1311_006232 [Hondaea fermentalgiana]|eukprot:GBG24405.1 Hypothetical Protein FCC1311_006232 [Hondaea fermentalgiana]